MESPLLGATRAIPGLSGDGTQPRLPLVLARSQKCRGGFRPPHGGVNPPKRPRGGVEPPRHETERRPFFKVLLRYFSSMLSTRFAARATIEMSLLIAIARCRANLSDFGLCATDVREPRQVRKEATVTSLSVCRRSTRSLTQPILDFRFWIRAMIRGSQPTNRLQRKSKI